MRVLDGRRVQQAAAVPAHLQQWSGGLDPQAFWSAWTRAEASCKLRDVPVTVWLRTHGLRPDPSAALRTFVLDDAVVTCGVLET